MPFDGDDDDANATTPEQQPVPGKCRRKPPPRPESGDDEERDPVLRPADPRNPLVRETAAIYVPHPHFVAVLQRIREAIDELHGCDVEPTCLNVGGPSGVGKSTLLRKLDADYPKVPDGVTIDDPLLGRLVLDHMPVALVRMPTSPTMLSLGKRILKRMGDPNWWRGDRTSVEGRVEMLFKRCGTKALVIDEAQRLADRGGTLISFDIVDWLRDIVADTGVILVLVGLGRMVEIIAQDEQFERRYDAGLRLKPYPWPSPKDGEAATGQDDFHAILSTVKELFPARFAEDLDVDHEDDTRAEAAALRFLYASRGLMGHLLHLLKHMAQIASKLPEADRRVGLEVAHEAFEKGFDYRRKGMANPFARDWTPVAPPPVEDDRILSAAAARRRKPTTQGQRRRRAIDALSKR